MTIWCTSDQHFGHRNIIQYCARPYSDVHNMNEDIVEKFNAVVHPEDTVWHLGDFAMDEKFVPLVLPRLMGHHKLISGNHDKCYSSHRKWELAMKRYLEYGFEEVLMDATVGPFRLCHVPYGSGRYSLLDSGSWLLCGHVHEQWKLKGKMINVGVDVWDMAPVSLETLMDIKNAEE